MISRTFWSCLVLLVLLVGGSFIWLFFNNLHTTSGQTEYLLVPEPTPREKIIQLLAEDTAHVRLRSAGLLLLDARLMLVDTVPSGRYAVEPDESDFAFWRTLRGRHQTPVRLTFNNIRTTEQLAVRLSEQLRSDSASFLQALTDSSLLAHYGVNRANVMTLFLPDTYEVYWTISPQELLERMKKETDTFWTAERRQEAKALGLTPQEVYTLASIVASETSQEDEKARIAGLYLNRLREGMMLQSDPTVIYALSAFGAHRVTASMIQVNSPYNTYQHQGLPPGPIRMATKLDLIDVLHAEKHHYLYMCARETFDGHHNFATSYAEHQQNAQRYQAELNKRNIHE